jgi:hypothetical protein
MFLIRIVAYTYVAPLELGVSELPQFYKYSAPLELTSLVTPLSHFGVAQTESPQNLRHQTHCKTGRISAVECQRVMRCEAP